VIEPVSWPAAAPDWPEPAAGASLMLWTVSRRPLTFTCSGPLSVVKSASWRKRCSRSKKLPSKTNVKGI